MAQNLYTDGTEAVSLMAQTLYTDGTEAVH
jgi:hypothetical protein